MLPKSVETPRGLYLKSIADKACAKPDGLNDWPMLTKDDYVLVGGIVCLYSYVDMNLRRILEVFDRVGELKEPWRSKTSRLSAPEVSDAIQTLPCWGEQERIALFELENGRLFRNLVAHFAIRRFPNDDAFLFLAKSTRDYKRVFGQEPPPGALLTAYADCEPIRSALRRVEGIQNWIGKVAPKLENELLPSSQVDLPY
jgi:hypothetical protein